MKRKVKGFSYDIAGKVLDIGCGEKPYKNIFCKVKKYIGTNSSQYYTSSLKFPEATDVVVDDGCKLPFRNGSFDSVLNFQVLPVFKEPDEFLKEVKRVLKTGSYFLLTTDFMYPIWNPPFNYYRHTKFGLIYLSEKNGFEVKRIEAIGGYWAMQARNLERYFRSQLSNFIKSFKNEKNKILKFLKIIRLVFWFILVIVAPILINISILIFHILDICFKDEEFTTGYIILMRKV